MSICLRILHAKSTPQQLSSSMQVLVAMAFFFLAAGLEQGTERAHLDVQRIMQSEGLQNPALPSLLKQILKRDAEDFLALGLFSLRKAFDGDFKAALKLARRLRKCQAPDAVLSLAGHLVSTFSAIGDGKSKRWASIAALKDLACTIFLMPDAEKTVLHSVVEQEARELATRFDSDFASFSRRQRYWKKRLPHYVPGLRALPFWDAKQFDLTLALESSAKVISSEISSLYNDAARWENVGKHTMARDEALVRSGSWVDLLIFSAGQFNEENCLKMPKTCDLLRSQTDLTTNPAGVALVSQLYPGTEVHEHVGLTNAELTFHLGIRVPGEGSAGIRVGGEDRHWAEGQVLVFDDSFNHTVWHRGSSTLPRTVLLVRAWHPEVSMLERQVALRLMQSNIPPQHFSWSDVAIQKAMDSLISKQSNDNWNALSDRIRTSLGIPQLPSEFAEDL
eukprot:TRINITY_DN26379_c0_g1_i1.p1 TRINITY_DN26379_c0_g1~~TRINITY_DN26379_c0_g1_i1.p1  ORF type:complete len:449 (+),score=57.78 TRINITY_DN26379_c0_g1_i1:37-1383(+)